MVEKTMNDQAKQYQEIIAKCWADEDFKQKLMADPITALQAEGIDVPDGMNVRVENTPQALTIVIPAPPAQLAQNELDGVAGGMGKVTLTGTRGTQFTIGGGIYGAPDRQCY
jgi:hypothetical protein